LPTNAGEALILLTAIFLGVPLPALPLQLLWINMTETAFGLPLAFEPKEPGLMQRPPRDPRQPIFTLPLLLRTLLVSILMLGGAFALFLWELHHLRTTIAEARTVVVNVILAIEGFYLFNCRSFTAGSFRRRIFSNPSMLVGVAVMLVAQLFFTYSPFMNRVFQSAPITFAAWLRVIGVAFACFILVGVEKRLRFRRQR
jgi:magnesium-transporting ATPase (P-type)